MGGRRFFCRPTFFMQRETEPERSHRPLTRAAQPLTISPMRVAAAGRSEAKAPPPVDLWVMFSGASLPLVAPAGPSFPA